MAPLLRSGSNDFDLAVSDADPRKKKDQASRDKRSPVAPLVELTSELLAKYTSESDDFGLAEAEADPRKKKDQASRDKRSSVAPLVELTSEFLAKHKHILVIEEIVFHCYVGSYYCINYWSVLQHF